MLRLVVAAVHFLSLAIGIGTNVARYFALEDPNDPKKRRALFAADNLSGVIAITWIGSGLWRAFGGLEKGTDYYLGNPFFHAKLGLIGLVFAFELWPMVTFIRWRYAERRGETFDTRRVPLLRKLIVAELVGTALVIVCASAMAQGFGARSRGEGYGRVKSVMLARCVSCHGPATRTAGLDLQSEPRAALLHRPSSQWPEAKLVVAGDPDRSLLVQKLRGKQTHGGAMPPAGPLPGAEIEAVEAWVKAGAPP
jgi:putative membrane protein